MSKYEQALFRSIIRSLGVMGCEDIKWLQGDSDAYKYVSEMLACMNNTRVAKRYKASVVCRDAELEYHTRLAMEGILPSDADDMDIFKYLIVVSQADRKVHLAEYPIEKKVFAYLYRYINETGCGECHYSHTILGVPLFIRAIEAMGILGMTKLLFVILDMVDYVFEFTANAPIDRQFEMANEWIEDIWEADDKRNILDGYDDDLALAIKSNEERLSVKRSDKFPISIGDIFNEFL